MMEVVNNDMNEELEEILLIMRFKFRFLRRVYTLSVFYLVLSKLHEFNLVNVWISIKK